MKQATLSSLTTPSKTLQKQKSRASILASTEKLLFQGGFAEASVSKLMKKAGLTVGGFYAHFRSKDDLLLEAFRSMLQGTLHRIQELSGPPSEKKEQFRSLYLSDKHRDSPELGCPIPAFLFETSKKSPQFRQRFSEILEASLSERAELLGIPKEKEDQLLAEYCQWIGAQMLARATKNSPFSDRVLESCRSQKT